MACTMHICSARDIESRWKLGALSISQIILMSGSGTLVVVVLKARNLPDKHTFYKQDVVSEVSLGSETLRTRIDTKGVRSG